MERCNSLTDNLRHLDHSLGQFRWALKTYLFWRSLWHIHFNALTINLLTLQKKQLKQYTISCKSCSRCIENYCFKHKNLVGCRELRPPDHPQWALPPGPPLGAPPPDPHYRLVLPRSPWACVWSHFSLPSAAPMCSHPCRQLSGGDHTNKLWLLKF